MNQAMMSRVQPQRDLLLDGTVEDSTPGVGPVEDLRRVGGVYPVFRQSLQCPYLFLNIRRQFRDVLLHKLPFHVSSPCALI